MKRGLQNIALGILTCALISVNLTPGLVEAAVTDGAPEKETQVLQEIQGAMYAIPGKEEFQVEAVNSVEGGTFQLQIFLSDINKRDWSIIDTIVFEVTGNGESTKKNTYKAEKAEEGKYTAEVNPDDWVEKNTGYKIQTYVSFNADLGFEPLQLDTYEYTVPAEGVLPDQEQSQEQSKELQSIQSYELPTELSVAVSEDEKTVIIRTSEIEELADGSSLKFAVWSNQNGQDDLEWYQAVYEGGTYSARIMVSDLDNPGSYTIHCYAFSADGSGQYISGNSFIISAPSVGTVNAGNLDTENGVFDIEVQNLAAKSGISQVRVGVWCRDDQSDMFWYEAEENNGVYSAEVSAANHGFHSGIYQIHVYVKDGNGFLTYVGGTTKIVQIENSKLYISTSNQKEYKISIGELEDSASVTQVRFAVWSDINGQDDLQWYVAETKNGTYTQTFLVSDHKSIGRYTIHCYAKYGDGSLRFINGGSCLVGGPSLNGISVSVPDAVSGQFNILLEGLSSPAGIEKIEVGVWSESNQSNLIWYEVAGTNKTEYLIAANLANHKNKLGTYNVHVYVTDGNGIKTFAGGTSYVMQLSYDSLKVSSSNTDSNVVINLEGMRTLGIVESVRFAVWSKTGGQKDLIWYQAVREGMNYSTTVDISSYLAAGDFIVHAYGVDKAGIMYFIAGTTFSVNGVVTVGAAAGGGFPVNISNLDASIVFSTVRVDVWTSADKGDIVHYTAGLKSGNTYVADVRLSDFSYNLGKYYIAVYTQTSSGIQNLIAETDKSISIQTGAFAEIAASSNGLNYTAVLEGIDLLGIQREVRFGVWSDVNGQDDFQWYTAAENGKSYSVTIPIGNHSGAGVYNVHAYYALPNGELRFLNAVTFQVQTVPTGAIEFSNVNGKDGTFKIIGEIGQVGLEVAKVKVGVWCTEGTYWYDMQEQADGSYTAMADVKDHGYRFGVYNAHIYVENSEGAMQYAAGGSVTVTADNYIKTSNPSSNICDITIYGPNVNGQTPDTIRFPSWSSEGDQDDLIWYDGIKNSDGSYSVRIDRNAHRRSGGFITHIYMYIGSSAYMCGSVEYSLYRSGEFDDYAQEVMHKIIFAVETGGQIYGNARYDDFTQAYKNSEKETAITIGAGAWFATEAKRLLNLIRQENPAAFAALDTAGIAYDLDHANWTTYGGDGNGNPTILKGSAKAVCIQAIISSETGIAIQNRLVDEQMVKYVNEAAALGVIDLKAQMFCANIRHLGGYSAMSWVVECCQADGKALTMENLWTSMRDHTPNKDGNGVGADKYKSRHEKVMMWLNLYID